MFFSQDKNIPKFHVQPFFLLCKTQKNDGLLIFIFYILIDFCHKEESLVYSKFQYKIRKLWPIFMNPESKREKVDTC